MSPRKDVNKRFSYITRIGRVLGHRACRFSDTRKERRRSLETNSMDEKRIRVGMADGPRASRPNFHCILETAGYYEREIFLPFFLVLSYLRFLYTSSLSCFLASLARFSICFLTDTNGSLEFARECEIRGRCSERIACPSNNL